MNETIHNALAELQDRLQQLDTINSKLLGAETQSKELINEAGEALSGIGEAMALVQSNHEASRKAMSSGYENLENSLLERGEALQALANDKVSALSQTIDESIQPYNDLVEAARELAEYLRSVNFPPRLDKIDSSVMTINQGVSNLSDKLDRQRDAQKSELETSFASLREDLKKSRAINYTLLSTNLVLVLVMLIVTLIK